MTVRYHTGNGVACDAPAHWKADHMHCPSITVCPKWGLDLQLQQNIFNSCLVNWHYKLIPQTSQRQGEPCLHERRLGLARDGVAAA